MFELRSALDEQELLVAIRTARRDAVALKTQGDRRGALNALRRAKALEAQRKELLSSAAPQEQHASEPPRVPNAALAPAPNKTYS